MDNSWRASTIGHFAPFGRVKTFWVSYAIVYLKVKTCRQRRIGTRGADKGAKEEIKQAIRRQVARSNENLDELLIKFITQERSQIIQTFLPK